MTPDIGVGSTDDDSWNMEDNAGPAEAVMRDYQVKDKFLLTRSAPMVER